MEAGLVRNVAVYNINIYILFILLGDIMNVNKKHYRTIWVKESDERIIQIIDQRSLPHKFII